MNNSDVVSLHLAEVLSNHGYEVYSPVQYSKTDNGYSKSELTLDECAYVELTRNHKFIYSPTVEGALEWLENNYPEWLVNVLWDNNMNGYYFTVQNTKTGYNYRMPSSPQENDKKKMYEWGIEHVLNRLED